MTTDKTESAFRQLSDAANRLVLGTRGKDYLVLEDGDEMLGYEETELESGFGEAVQTIVKLSGTAAAPRKPECIAAAIEALVVVRPAVRAYRSRMFQYATDWGSELSPAALHARKLLLWVREAAACMTRAEKDAVFEGLPPHVREARFPSYWFSSWDTHTEEEVRVAGLLGR